MIARLIHAPAVVRIVGVCLVASSLTACRHKEPTPPPVAAATVTLNRDKAPLGSPLEITYKLTVQPDAHFTEDYRVMVHIIDTDEELLWTDDHNPPTPTTQWKPGQVIEYTRTVFVPAVPYVGEASIQIGLYSAQSQKRLPLVGEDMGQRAYKAGRLQIQPQTENVFTLYKDGWHQTEVAEHNAHDEWQWTKKTGTLAFKNPKRDCVFYLDLDNPGSDFPDRQHVQVALNGTVIHEFDLTPKNRILRQIPLTASLLGSADMAEIQIAVDKTFIPAVVNASNSKDVRELGVRVFHAFVDAR